MCSYLGEIRIVNEYVNFKPYYRYSNGSFLSLSRNDRQILLPDSEFEDINLCSPNSDIEKKYYNHEYLLLDFKFDDLEDNFNSFGGRNRTGYKIDISKLQRDKLRTLNEIGFYRLIRSKDVLSDISGQVIQSEKDYCKNQRLRINDHAVYEGMRVVLEIANESNVLLGPFMIGFRSLDSRFIVNTFTESNKYIIPALRYDNGVESNVLEFGAYELQTFVRIDESICKVKELDSIPQNVILK
ncbi:MAG: hypothetical protein LBM60_02605 [Clostridium sp.]|nr:hypothetical protein [Clostridium sp.]